MAKLVLEDISHQFGSTKAVQAANLTVEEGNLVTLVGPSGCGKSTLLRIIAGFIDPKAGRVVIDGQDVTALPPHRRSIGMVFQDYALFPHLTVAENIAFGLHERKVPRPRIYERVAELLDLVHLTGYEQRLPGQLSGGQQQRVALVRAIAHPPRVLLMDEPFSALDRRLRDAMQIELRRLQRQLKITTVFVTHDRSEAMNLSDHMVVMSGGHILQRDTPKGIYTRPTNRFVAEFLGDINILQTRGTNGTVMAIRPENVRLIDGRQDGSNLSTVAAKVTSSAFLGNVRRYTVDVGGQPWLVETRGNEPPPAEETSVVLGWLPSDVLVIHE